MEEENKGKEFWVTNNRFKFIAIILFLMFLIFMLLIFLRGEAITRDPCSICAEKMGENVVCSLSSGGFLFQKTYHSNNTITGEG